METTTTTSKMPEMLLNLVTMLYNYVYTRASIGRKINQNIAEFHDWTVDLFLEIRVIRHFHHTKTLLRNQWDNRTKVIYNTYETRTFAKDRHFFELHSEAHCEHQCFCNIVIDVRCQRTSYDIPPHNSM